MKQLHEINGRWAVRMVVPLALRSTVGKPELRQWMGSHKKVVERGAYAVVARFLTITDDAKAQAAPAPKCITEGQDAV